MHIGRRVELRAAHGVAHRRIVRGRGSHDDGHGIDAADRDACLTVQRRCRVHDARSVRADRDRRKSVAAAGWDANVCQDVAGPRRAYHGRHQRALHTLERLTGNDVSHQLTALNVEEHRTDRRKKSHTQHP